MPKKVYIVDNLDCAHCAAKIEEKISKLPQVQDVSLTFATKQLRVTAEDPDALLPEILDLARTVEHDVAIRPREEQIHHEHSHHHDGACCCGHEHHHHEKEDCCCGHEHHHHHEEGDCCGHEHHHHEEGDCCGHEHHHHEEGDCCCGHEHHHHHEEEDCCCGHEHHHHEEENCCCSHEHHHHHEEEECCCGHEHHHHHEEEDCCCGHKHHDHRNGSNTHKQVYLMENLDCAHCAAKIESKIAAIPGVEEAVITFSTKQLRLTAENPEALMPQILAAARSVEADVNIVARSQFPTDTGRETVQKENAEKTGRKFDLWNSLKGIILGAVLFALGLIAEHMELPAAALLISIAAYAVLGLGVVRKAVINLRKGNALDENFLMSLASIGAFFVGQYTEAVGVMLFYRVGEYFEEKAVERSRSQIMDAVDLRPEVVNLVQGDEIQVIPAQEAEIGDLLLVRPGDRIPLDGIVVKGESRIDTAPITGEPVPVGVKPGDNVISGCVNTVGQLTIRAEKRLSESMVTRILDSVENAAASKPKIDRFITRFARVYTPLVVIVAVLTAIIPSLITGNWSHWIYTAMTFLVMSCPCALVLSVPLAFFAGIGAGSKRGVLFKGGTSMEAMKNVKAVVMDKTGTVTKGEFKVQKVLGDENLLGLCASCEQRSTHPIAVSIVTEAKNQGLTLSVPDDLEEISGKGICARVDGKEVLCGNHKLLEDRGIAFEDASEAGTHVLVAVDGRFAGCIVIDDTLKPDAKSALKKLKVKGISTYMLTGDAEPAAKAVAAQVGVDQVRAGLLPGQKLEHLQKIRETEGTVMFVGDGINDAPVLAGADVGAAMGSGADAAIEAADVVFMTSEVEAIPLALDIAKRTGFIAWTNVIFALAVKFAVMVLGLFGIASMWLAVFADTGVAMICILNSIRLLYSRK